MKLQNPSVTSNTESKTKLEEEKNIKDDFETTGTTKMPNCGETTFVEQFGSPILDVPNLGNPSEICDGNSDQKVELLNEVDEWQYQLPSPPIAFKDCSPTNLTDITDYDTVTIQDFKTESIITNPELFEKLKVIKDDFNSEKLRETSEINATGDELVLSSFTLANLEKRKSLVYNRELCTSLKNAQGSNSNQSSNSLGRNEVKSSQLTCEPENDQNGNKSNNKIHSSEMNNLPMDNLPNFKISTYNSMEKINIFEDDSIRSNIYMPNKYSSYVDLSTIKSNKQQFTCSSSNTNANESEIFKKPHAPSKYKSKVCNYSRNNGDLSIGRSESFSTNQNMNLWKMPHRVQRSKSQINLDKYKEKSNPEIVEQNTLSKCNSLFDVSGLQSLEVRFFYFYVH